MFDVVGHFDAVQDHVGGGQHVGQRFLFDAVDGLLQGLFIGSGFYIAVALVFDGAGEEATSTAGGVDDALFQLGVDAVDHEFGDRPWRIEFPGVAGALQVFENLLVDVTKGVALLGLVEVDALLDLVDHLADELAGFHVVVGVFKYAADHVGAFVLFVARHQGLQLGEQGVVDEVFQLIAGGPFGIGGPVAPAQVVGQRRLVVILHQLPLLLAVVVDLEEEHPDQLADALGVAIDADILAHDVLDGFDGTGNRHGHFFRWWLCGIGLRPSGGHYIVPVPAHGGPVRNRICR